MEYCRICLTQNFDGKNMFNIFFHNNLIKTEYEEMQQLNTNNIRSILHKYCWFLILERDEHSHQICQQCWKIVSEFDKFTKQIKQSQNKLFNITAAPSSQCSSEESEIEIKFEEDSIVDCDVEVTLDDDFKSYSSNSSNSSNSSDSSYEMIEEIQPLKKRKTKKKEHTKTVESVSPGVEKERLKKINKEDEMINEFFNMDCEICSENLSNVRSLFRHYGKSHKLRGYLRCCGKKLKRCYAIDHITLHKNPNAFQCQICERNYQCSYSLSIHMKQHDDKFEPFQCEKCPRSFMKPESLRSHFRFAHHEIEKQDHQNDTEGTVPIKKEKNNFSCKECNKTFPTELQRKRHRHRNNTVICAICAKVCSSGKGLRIHHDAAHSTDNLRSQCTECQRWFKNEETRRVHARVHKIELHTCDICNREFTNVVSFRQHKRRSHVPLNHSCVICKKAFAVPGALRKHMKGHAGQLLKCPICANILETKNGLEFHMKKWHQTEVEDQII